MGCLGINVRSYNTIQLIDKTQFNKKFCFIQTIYLLAPFRQAFLVELVD
jgi:hypothetical protein